MRSGVVGFVGVKNVPGKVDSQPELLFTLRQVDAAELLSKAGGSELTAPAAGERTLAADDLSALFGLEMEGLSTAATAAPMQPRPATVRRRLRRRDANERVPLAAALRKVLLSLAPALAAAVVEPTQGEAAAETVLLAVHRVVQQ